MIRKHRWFRWKSSFIFITGDPVLFDEVVNEKKLNDGLLQDGHVKPLERHVVFDPSPALRLRQGEAAAVTEALALLADPDLLRRRAQALGRTVAIEECAIEDAAAVFPRALPVACGAVMPFCLAQERPVMCAAAAAALAGAAAFSSTGAEVVAVATPPPLPQVQSGPHDSAAAPTRTVDGSAPSTGPPSARSWSPSAARSDSGRKRLPK